MFNASTSIPASARGSHDEPILSTDDRHADPADQFGLPHGSTATQPMPTRIASKASQSEQLQGSFIRTYIISSYFDQIDIVR